MDTGTLNLAWARALVAGLYAAGVREAILSPGSRSTPLALAFLRQPGMACHVLVDERSAAFFALGLARGKGRPPALIATSGSAPANWFPAVLEASQAAVPLLLLSADRPAELRGWGANQTVDQQGLFGVHVRASHALSPPDPAWLPDYARLLAARMVSESLSPLPGPVHANLPFREPLLPAGQVADAPDYAPLPLAAAERTPRADDVARLAARLSGRPGVILAGGGDYPARFPEAVSALAERLGAPILAEPLSGLRFGPHSRRTVFARQEAFLRRASFTSGHRPDWVLRFGTAPVSRSVQSWLAGCGAEQILLDPAGRWHDPQHGAGCLIQCDALPLCRALSVETVRPAPDAWLAAFRAEEERAGALANALPPEGGFEGALVPALLERLPEGHRLFCGNSMAMRDLDTFSGTGPQRLSIHGNRGASGIDGNVATAAGLAACGPTVALLGDVSCAHDLGSLAAARSRPLVLVVLNNGGGGIFGYLPQVALPEFERAWLTPPGADLAHAAATWGIPYARAGRLADFLPALASALAAGGPHLIEVEVDREGSLARHKAYWQAVAAPD